jgi:hypothetical protein
MKLKTVNRLAMVLIISQLRATRRTSSSFDFLRKPSAILLIDAVAFVGAIIFVQRFVSFLASNISPMVVQILIDLPMFLIFIVMISGLLWELSYSFTFTSSDMVNYLPVSASEYVLASSTSTVFYYSIFLAATSGGTLALALQYRLLTSWILMTAMDLVAVFIGAFGVEALRAFTNRASSILYKRSGKSVLILRMVVLIAALVFFQLIFNPTVMLSLLGNVTGGVKAVWYFPLVWPSLVVLSFLEHNLLSTSLYMILTFFFAGFFFSVCVRLRQVYWMPVPVSVRLSTGAYAPKLGFLSRLGLNTTEAAIVRKDLKSLTRRREMARILALPILIVVSMMIPSLTSARETPTPYSVMFWPLPILFGIMLLVLMNSMISIGQEGYAIWNLYASPIMPKELVKAKMSMNIILSLPVALAFWIGITILGHLSFRASTAFLLVSISLIFTESLLGLIIGIRFPDFTETLRSRFVSITGMLLGMLLGIVVAGVIATPYAAYLSFKPQWMARSMYFILTSLVTLLLTTLFSVIGYRLCLTRIKNLFRELPI